MTKQDSPDTLRCRIVYKDDKAWVLAMYWSDEFEGDSSGEIVAEYASFKTAAASALGRDVRKALKKYVDYPDGAELPADPIENMSGGKRSKFTKGSIAVAVSWRKPFKTLTIQGGSAPTAAGAIFQLPLDPFHEKITNEELGKAIIKLIKSIKKKDGL